MGYAVPREPGYVRTWIRARAEPGYIETWIRKIRIRYSKGHKYRIQPSTLVLVLVSVEASSSNNTTLHDLVGRRAEISFLAHLEKPLDYEPGSSGFETRKKEPMSGIY